MIERYEADAIEAADEQLDADAGRELLAEMDASTECHICHGLCYTGSTEMRMGVNGPEDTSAPCWWCYGEGVEPELTSTRTACPNCNEMRMDSLVFDDDGDLVTCESCGHVYDPSEMTAYEMSKECR